MVDQLSAPFMTTKQAARFLSERRGVPVAAATLRKLRVIGGGPEFRKFGRLVVYAGEALVRWADSRISSPMKSTSVGVDERR